MNTWQLLDSCQESWIHVIHHNIAPQNKIAFKFYTKNSSLNINNNLTVKLNQKLNKKALTRTKDYLNN